MIKKLFILPVIVCIPFTGSVAQSWHTVPGKIEPPGAIVKALYVLKDTLYVGGDFYYAGGIRVNHVASFDGTNWDTLGSGFYGQGVECFASYQNELYMGGGFYGPSPVLGNAAGGVPYTNKIARWDGAQWKTVGGGINMFATTKISAMAVYKGELYAGGVFFEIGGLDVMCCIARWDGTNWDSVGSFYGAVRAMVVFNNELYVAGGGNSFTAGGVDSYNIARWNGSQWNRVGLGLGMYEFCSVYSLAVDTVNNILYAGGGCYYAYNADSTEVLVNFIAQWDGNQWSSLGSGETDGVLALAMYHGELYAGGAAGGVSANYIARWDGSQWKPLGVGTNLTVFALEVYKDTLYVGGVFTMAGGDSAFYIAKWHTPPDTTTGIAVVKSEEYGLKVYPNPTKESFTIETHLPNTENGMIRIYGLNGELVQEHALKKGSNSTILNTSSWAK